MFVIIDIVRLDPDEKFRTAYHAPREQYPAFVALRVGDLTLHLDSAEQARSLVEAAGRAASLLAHCQECGGLLPGHTMACAQRAAQSDEATPELAVTVPS